MRRLTGVFSNNEYKIIPYCIYHDLTINAVIDLDGSLSVCDKDDKNKCSTLFYLSEEKVLENVVVKSMKMSQFIKMSKAQKVKYIDLCNTSQSLVSRLNIEAAEKWTKEAVDKLLIRYPNKAFDLSFLDEQNLIIHQDSDKIVVTKTFIEGFLRCKQAELIKDLFDKLGVTTFKELEEYVAIGKKYFVN